MVRIFKIMLTLIVLSSASLSAWADRGIGKKGKAKVFTLNIATPSTLRSSVSLNLKSGLIYKGSTLGAVTPAGTPAKGIISYQKGNNVYVLPYKQKIAVPEVKQGYTGLKLIIRTN
jgi:hypothetical protein